MNLTEKEFRENSWNDFEFSYNDDWYYICPVNGKFSAGKANTDPQYFDTVDDLLDNFIIHGKQLKTVLSDIDW